KNSVRARCPLPPGYASKFDDSRWDLETSPRTLPSDFWASGQDIGAETMSLVPPLPPDPVPVRPDTIPVTMTSAGDSDGYLPQIPFEDERVPGHMPLWVDPYETPASLKSCRNELAQSVLD